MTVLGEFIVPNEAFPLAQTRAELPTASISMVRVTISPEVLSPYLWVSAVDFEAFEEVARADRSVEDILLLDQFDQVALYRVAWAASVEETTHAFADADRSILTTYSTDSGWYLRVQFPDRDALAAFRTDLKDGGVSFRVLTLVTTEQAPTGLPYGLTEKQTEALMTAWERGYFEVPRATTLDEVATAIGISQQALSDRLRRGYDALIRNTLGAPVHNAAPDVMEGTGGSTETEDR